MLYYFSGEVLFSYAGAEAAHSRILLSETCLCVLYLEFKQDMCLLSAMEKDSLEDSCYLPLSSNKICVWCLPDAFAVLSNFWCCVQFLIDFKIYVCQMDFTIMEL
jgi:hypothetical protein